MIDRFEIHDPAGIRMLLQACPLEISRKGRKLWQEGRVSDLIPLPGGRGFSTVLATEEVDYPIRLLYDTAQGWRGLCGCGGVHGCVHVYAAFSALLGEHARQAVDVLTGSPAMAGKAIAQARVAAAPAESSDLGRRLSQAVGRALTPKERAFVSAVDRLFRSCRRTGQLAYSQLAELGLPVRAYGDADLWDRMPIDSFHFWQYVAVAAQEMRLSVPMFMAPVTDASVIHRDLDRRRRAREAAVWKVRLESLSLAPEPAVELTRKSDLRLVISREGGWIEWLDPDREAFVKLREGVDRFLERVRTGELELPLEAELLLPMVRASVQDPSYTMEWGDEAWLEDLASVVLSQHLASRITDPDGRPLSRPSEPLRWDLTPAKSEEDNYVLQLLTAEGALVPPCLAVINTLPTRYVTAEAIYRGPRMPRELCAQGAAQVEIPAPGLEQSSGIRLLKVLGLELPMRIQQRLKAHTFTIDAHCSLMTQGIRSRGEVCMISATARTDNGLVMALTGRGWEDKTPGKGPDEKDGEIPWYDREPLDQFFRSLHPLHPKPNFYQPGLEVRVTRQFPGLFAQWLRSHPSCVRIELDGELASLAAEDIHGRVKLEVTESEIDWFDLKVVLDVSDTTLTPEEIKLLLDARGGYVRLEGKGWRRLRYDLDPADDEQLARLGLSPREFSGQPQRLHALQLADAAAARFLPAEQATQVQRRAAEIQARVTPALPAEVCAELRPYQLEGFHFLAYLASNRFGGILADDMGLGKTLQTLAWLVWLHREEQSRHPDKPCAPSLVVCPKSVSDNWHAEGLRFTPGLRIRCWHAADLDALPDAVAEADVHVINYSQLRLLADPLVKLRWHAVVLDEGQYIKSPESQTARIARALRGRHRLVLSGTPIENRLLDLWSLMSFAMPGVLGPRAEFARLYDSRTDPLARKRLASRVRPFLIRRTKAQVARELPDRIEEDLYCEMEGPQQALYKAELKKAQRMLLGMKEERELARLRFNFLTSLLRLRQICCDPRLVKPDLGGASAKVEALIEHLEPLMEEGHKVLVFSQFVELLKLLKPVLAERQWRTLCLVGDTENRGELVREFQSLEGPAVFLISLKAGGFGLNLTAASYVVLFDPWWNPAVESQAIDRTHRIGQTQKVIAYRLLIKDSIEEKIRELQKRKRFLAEDVLGEERFSQALGLEDLRFLFSD